MTQPTAAAAPTPSVRSWSRAVVVVLICMSAALLLSIDAVYGALQRVLSAAEPLIAGHPYLGAVVFVVLAAVSAVLAFFSSALLLPAAVYAWGDMSPSVCCGSAGCWVACAPTRWVAGCADHK